MNTDDGGILYGVIPKIILGTHLAGARKASAPPRLLERPRGYGSSACLLRAKCNKT